MSILGMFKIIFLFILLNLVLVYAVEFTISSTPSNSKVWIDGVYTHHLTPTDEVEQSDVIELWGVGTHTLKLTKSGYLLEQEIELVEGERLSLDLIIPEIDSSSDSSNDSSSDYSNDCPSCPECEECEECDDCPKCEICVECTETIKYVEKIVYVQNNTCEIEKVINPVTGNIVYKTDNKAQRYGLYFLCFVLVLMVVALYAKKRNYNKGYY